MDRRSDSPPPLWASRFADFEGGGDVLAEALGELTRDLSIEGPEPTPRLIRYYAAEDVIDKPERRGKEAIYRFRQIAQFLAARVLLAEGWPLKKIAEDLKERSLEEILALIPAPPAAPRPSAADLVRGFQLSAGMARSSGFREPEGAAPRAREPASREAASMQTRRYDAASRKARLARSLSTLPTGAAAPEPREAVRLDLTEQVTLLIDQTALQALTTEQAQTLGDAVRDALLEARRRRSLSKKP